MHCTICDKRLNDFESTRRHAVTLDFLDMCNRCYQSVSNEVGLATIDRKDLINCKAVEELDKDDNLCYPNYKEL